MQSVSRKEGRRGFIVEVSGVDAGIRYRHATCRQHWSQHGTNITLTSLSTSEANFSPQGRWSHILLYCSLTDIGWTANHNSIGVLYDRMEDSGLDLHCA